MSTPFPFQSEQLIIHICCGFALLSDPLLSLSILKELQGVKRDHEQKLTLESNDGPALILQVHPLLLGVATALKQAYFPYFLLGG